jgi:transcriptional regulator with XRE-family HTH domain
VGDNELGAFLRARREAVSPIEVGLPNGGRRRTPGLRRAELATLAGVSVDYLARLEQGRDRHPSAQVLAALADALRLPTDERLLLHRLGKATSGFFCLGGEPPARAVRPTVRALLDRLEPAPAFVVNRVGDVLAWTTGYQRVAGPVGLLDFEPPNLVRFVFTDPRARVAYPEWDRVAGEQLANLKIESSHTDPHVAQLAEELTITAGAPFRDGWLAPPVHLPPRSGMERLVHPEVGEVRLAYEILELPATDDQRLVVYLPGDAATAAALDHLTDRQRELLPAARPG